MIPSIQTFRKATIICNSTAYIIYAIDIIVLMQYIIHQLLNSLYLQFDCIHHISNRNHWSLLKLDEFEAGAHVLHLLDWLGVEWLFARRSRKTGDYSEGDLTRPSRHIPSPINSHTLSYRVIDERRLVITSNTMSLISRTTRTVLSSLRRNDVR
ncbi:hypothetical protein SeMB42_g05304 [Synchytrium endobioticum]|uniref:Uncharacterized protein n=1 Tax=Synchytrium endobioticum TaxID=286115 RepID=A0A507CSC5_9FUNG|nr:hypothetical protein SeMB42_g05304 [Synchytrium endobioticum]